MAARVPMFCLMLLILLYALLATCCSCLPVSMNCNIRCSIHCTVWSVTKHWHMLPEHHQGNCCLNQTCILCYVCNCWSTDAKICRLQLHFASNTEWVNRKQTVAFANNWTSAICGRFAYWKPIEAEERSFRCVATDGWLFEQCLKVILAKDSALGDIHIFSLFCFIFTILFHVPSLLFSISCCTQPTGFEFVVVSLDGSALIIWLMSQLYRTSTFAITIYLSPAVFLSPLIFSAPAPSFIYKFSTAKHAHPSIRSSSTAPSTTPDSPIWLQSSVSPTARIAAAVICITVRGCLSLFVVHRLCGICCSLFTLVIIRMPIFCCFGFTNQILCGSVGFAGFCCLIAVLRYRTTVCLCMLWVC